MNALRWLVLVLVAAAILWIRIVPRVFHESGLVSAPVTTETRPIDDAAAIIARFGKPDRDQITPAQQDALPKRVIVYRDLQIVFVERDSTAGRLWRLVGFIDAKTGMTLTGGEALGRLLHRN
jgi:hypothetical protein